ncbi:MAG: NrfD/PsrC family molybdoenzyme membrane anchor subunit [Vicinamibacterales bacterium]
MLAVIVAAGIGTFFFQATRGYGLTGTKWPNFWGFLVIDFVFWIGISHAGTLISAILRLVNAGWRRPVTRCAEVITAFALMIERLVPDHAPRQAVAVLLAGAAPEPSPHLAELPFAAGVGLFRDLHLPHRQPAVPLPADDSGLRSGFATARPACGASSTACWPWDGVARRSSGTVSKTAMQIMAIAIIPVAVSVHTIVSFDFSMAPTPMWHSSIFGPYFVAGAIFSGIAGLIIAMAALRRVLHLHEYLEDIHFENLGKLLLTMSLLWGYFTFNERLTAWYGNHVAEVNTFHATQTGPTRHSSGRWSR